MIIQGRNPSNLPLIDYRTLQPFQGDLKELPEENYKHLLAIMQRHGFDVPVSVWFKPEGKPTKKKGVAGGGLATVNDLFEYPVIPYLMDGHQRRIVLVGNEIQLDYGDGPTYLVPYYQIKADNEQQAKERLLAITSQQGIIREPGLAQFTNDMDRDYLGLLHYQGIDLSSVIIPVVEFAERNDDEDLYTAAAPLYSTGVERAAPIQMPETKYDGRGNKVEEKEKEHATIVFPVSVMLEKQESIRWKKFKETNNLISDKDALVKLLDLADPKE